MRHPINIRHSTFLGYVYVKLNLTYVIDLLEIFNIVPILKIRLIFRYEVLKMVTEAQIRANQENAKKSTGPTTNEGKQKSSKNAMTHGIFANIPVLPGENEADLNELKAQIIQALKPTDAIELGFVERIIQSRFRQIRLREAEAAKLKISTMPEVLAESITHTLRHSTLKKYNAEDLSVQSAYTYRFYQDALEEIDKSGYESHAISIETVKEKMPKTLHFLEARIKKHLTLTWDEFIKNPVQISKVIGEARVDITGFIESNRNNSIARSIANEMKIVHRIPQGQDMVVFSKYQTQLDADIERAMKGLYVYRNNKAKVIEGEVIEDVST